MTWTFSGRRNGVLEFAGDTEDRTRAMSELVHYIYQYLEDVEEDDRAIFKLEYKPKKKKVR